MGQLITHILPDLCPLFNDQMKRTAGFCLGQTLVLPRVGVHLGELGAKCHKKGPRKMRKEEGRTLTIGTRPQYQRPDLTAQYVQSLLSDIWWVT